MYYYMVHLHRCELESELKLVGVVWIDWSSSSGQSLLLGGSLGFWLGMLSLLGLLPELDKLERRA